MGFSITQPLWFQQATPSTIQHIFHSFQKAKEKTKDLAIWKGLGNQIVPIYMPEALNPSAMVN